MSSKAYFVPINLYKTLYLQVYGLRNKARTLIYKMGLSELKEWRKARLMIVKSTWRVVKWRLDCLKFHCAKPWRKELSWQENGAVGGSPVVPQCSVGSSKVKTLRMLKADLLHQVTLRNTFLAIIDTFFNIYFSINQLPNFHYIDYSEYWDKFYLVFPSFEELRFSTFEKLEMGI